MTREEALAKDQALLEIIDAVRNLPTLFINFGGQAMCPNMINRDKVIGILQRYGFNDAPYQPAKK